MTLQELLNSQMDLQSIAAAARQGLAWWIDELAALLPPSWRSRLSSRPRVLAEPLAAGGWQFWYDGRPFEGDRPPRSAEGVVGLLLPPGAVLAREIQVPR